MSNFCPYFLDLIIRLNTISSCPQRVAQSIAFLRRWCPMLPPLLIVDLELVRLARRRTIVGTPPVRPAAMKPDNRTSCRIVRILLRLRRRFSSDGNFAFSPTGN